MKKMKKVLFLVLTIISTIAVCLFCNIKTTDSVSAEYSDKYNANVFNYISLSQAGQQLNTSHLKTVKENEKNITYIVTNSAVTMTFINPISTYTTITPNTNMQNFYRNEAKIVIERDTESGEFPISFDFNDKTYYYNISGTMLYIKTNPAASPITNSTNELIRYTEETDKITIYITTSFTATGDDFVDISGNKSQSCPFEFTIVGAGTFALNFQKPIVNFNNLIEPIVMFDTYQTDDLGNPYPEVKAIASNQTFAMLKVTFVTTKYTENNPLYFNLNKNGFIYNYTLYSKVINGEDLLFVDYVDHNLKDNNKNLATTYMYDEDGKIVVDEHGNSVIDPTKKVKTIVDGSGEENLFSIIFDNKGRYELEIYDGTYDTNKADGDTSMINYNYYKTSFFIREEGPSVLPFENIYFVGQTINDDGTFKDYIVSNSTLNDSVNVTIKNLSDFGNSQTKLQDVVENIVVKVTDFGIDKVTTTETTYLPQDILNALSNNDFSLSFTEDAYYQIIINPKQPTDGSKTLTPIYYYFTIVKHAKTTFRFNEEATEATIPFVTQYQGYTNLINDSIELKIQFVDKAAHKVELDKVYINQFTVKFGVKSVKIEEFTPVAQNENEKIPDGVYLKVYGVGDITVYITYNGVAEDPFILNSENHNNTISRTEYGTYTIKIVDSMGTTFEDTYVLKKGLNTSAILLIVFSSIILLVITVFVLRARGKVSTR